MAARLAAVDSTRASPLLARYDSGRSSCPFRPSSSRGEPIGMAAKWSFPGWLAGLALAGDHETAVVGEAAVRPLGVLNNFHEVCHPQRRRAVRVPGFVHGPSAAPF